MSSPSRFLIALFALFCGAASHAQTVVRVLHYNIHRDIGSSSPDTAGQPSLAKIVNYLAPDVWAINELGWSGSSAASAADLAAFINARLTIFGPNPQAGVNYFIYVGTRTDGFITNAIVSRYPLLATRTYANAGAFYPALRGLVSARVDLPGPVELGVFTAHFKASSLSDTIEESNVNAQKRQDEANTDAVNLTAWLSAFPDDGAVMTGDFNETEEAADVDNWKGGPIGGTLPNGLVYHPITTLRNAGFADAGPVSIAANRDTIDATSPDSRFDYILHRASHITYLAGEVFDADQYTAAQLAALNAANSTNFTRSTSAIPGDSEIASDHLPVLEVFLVSPGPAYLAAQSASSLASTSVTLNATINPNGFATTYRIELGTTTAYGLTSFSQVLAAGTTNANVTLNAAGLAPGTTFHYRIVAENSAGVSVGPDRIFTTAAFVDSDGDSLPNDWETAQGLNPNLASDAPLDRDGDGASNRDEYRAGTNARAPLNVFRITAVEREGGDYVISWPSIFGKRYELQARPNYTTGSWLTLQTGFAGTGAALEATDAGAVLAFTERLYRVVTLP